MLDVESALNNQLLVLQATQFMKTSPKEGFKYIYSFLHIAFNFLGLGPQDSYTPLNIKQHVTQVDTFKRYLKGLKGI